MSRPLQAPPPQALTGGAPPTVTVLVNLDLTTQICRPSGNLSARRRFNAPAGAAAINMLRLITLFHCHSGVNAKGG